MTKRAAHCCCGVAVLTGWCARRGWRRRGRGWLAVPWWSRRRGWPGLAEPAGAAARPAQLPALVPDPADAGPRLAMLPWPCGGPWPLAASRPAGGGHRHRGAVAQPVGAVGHHLLAGLQSRQHRHEAAIGRPHLDRTHRDRVVGVDDIDIRARLAALHRRHRHPDGVLHRVHQQSGVHELVRVQHLVRVGEHRAQLHRAGGGVDLVVQRAELSGRQQLHVGPVIGRDAQRCAGAHPLDDFRQIVLRHREQHRDRLHLRDHDEAGGAAGLDVIALIDLAQPDLPVDRRDDVAIGQIELRVVHRALVGLHGAGVLLHQIALIVQLLLRDRVLPAQGLVALQVGLAPAPAAPGHAPACPAPAPAPPGKAADRSAPGSRPS